MIVNAIPDYPPLQVWFDGRVEAKSVEWPEMDVEEMTRWIRRVHTPDELVGGCYRGAQSFKPDTTYTPLPRSWEAYNRGVWESVHFPVVEMKWWTSIWDAGSPRSKVTENGPWAHGFPHEHGWGHGVTLVMMVQPAEEGGETVLLPRDGKPPIEVSLDTGEGVLIGGTLRHGVRPTTKGERLMVISTAHQDREAPRWDLL